MKDESSPETSSAAASRAEQLRSLLSCVEECAQDVLCQYDRLYPALYALSPVPGELLLTRRRTGPRHEKQGG